MTRRRGEGPQIATGEPVGTVSSCEVELTGITKRFGALVANDDVDFAVRTGDIHAVIGENGAGKSTLMSIMYGLLRPDAGTIRVRGQEMQFRSAVDAIRAGLGMVHQGFKLFDSMSVTDNVIYRSEPVRGGFLNRRAARARVAEIAERYRLDVDPDARISDLPVGVRQRVEILKALYRDARLLILDEPTAALTPAEADALFEVLRDMADDGRTIIIVTHKLNEVMSVSDSVTVMRDGKVVSRMKTSDTSAAAIAQAMTGREVLFEVASGEAHPGAPVLQVDGITVKRVGGQRAIVDGVSLTVHGGEIVGIAGVSGNGQTELIQAIVGLRHADRGEVRVDRVDVSRASVMRRREAGLAYVPEDRHATGTAGPASVKDNLVMGFHHRAPLASRGFLNRDEMRRHAERLIHDYDVRLTSPDVPVAALSGGNMQKVVVAREMAHGASLLIAEQPARGVDVGAIEYIHRALIDYRDAGHGVLLVSNEMSEVLALSDRILVMFEGRISGELSRAEATAARLGRLMLGLPAEEVRA